MEFEKVKEIIVDSLSCDEDAVTLEANLKEDLDADSLDAVELIMAVEEEFDIEIPDDKAADRAGRYVRHVRELFQQRVHRAAFLQPAGRGSGAAGAYGVRPWRGDRPRIIPIRLYRPVFHESFHLMTAVPGTCQRAP